MGCASVCVHLMEGGMLGKDAHCSSLHDNVPIMAKHVKVGYKVYAASAFVSSRGQLHLAFTEKT